MVGSIYGKGIRLNLGEKKGLRLFNISQIKSLGLKCFENHG